MKKIGRKVHNLTSRAKKKIEKEGEEKNAAKRAQVVVLTRKDVERRRQDCESQLMELAKEKKITAGGLQSWESLPERNCQRW